MNRMENRLVLLLMALLMAVSLCSCGSDAETKRPQSSEPSQSAAEAQENVTVDEAATVPIEEESEQEETAQAKPEQTVFGNEVDWELIQDRMRSMADRLTNDLSLSIDSMQFAVMDGGDLRVSGVSGVYDHENSRELKREDMYGVGSVSKVIAVAAVMKLSDRGLVELDEPVVSYLPELRMKDKRYQEITVRMLMDHSSGLLGNTASWAWRLGAFGDRGFQDCFLPLLEEQDLKDEPGAYGVYCNDGFTLLELLCEKVSGQPYEQWLRGELFDPLGMEHSCTPMDCPDESEIVKTYFGSSIEALPTLTLDPGFGGVFSTAEDLCRFGRAFTAQGSDVLSKETASEMAEAAYQNGVWYERGESVTNYGLGWDAVDLYPFSEMGIKAVTKNGDVLLSGSQLLVLPELNLVAAVTASGQSASVGKAFLIQSMLDILLDKGLIDSVPMGGIQDKGTVALTKDMTDYAGMYVRTSGTFEIAFQGNELVKTSFSDGSVQTYHHIGDGVFTDGDSVEVWFVQADGNTYLVQRTWDNGYGLITLPEVSFVGVQTDTHELDESTKAAWRNRKGKRYLLVSEPADSMGYLYPAFGLALPSFKMTVNADVDSVPFWRGMKIIDEDHAENQAKVPANASTNAVSAEFFTQEGTEYVIFSNGLTYREANGLPALTPENDVTVMDEAMWYRVNESRTLSYQMPEGCSIAVYDSELNNTGDTIINGSDSISVSEGGYIAFIGRGTFQIIQ